MTSTAESTRRKVLRSTLWTTQSKILSQALGFVTTLVLARLLDRDDFGLMAMALSFIGLVETIVDLGFLSAIIQAREIQRKQLSSCFWVLSALSLAVALVALVGAPWVSRAFAEAGVTGLVRWLTPLFLLAPLNIICKGILSRELRLDTLARIELYACIPKMALAVLLAAAGFGVYSLVLSYVLERVLQTLWCVIAARWYPRFEFDRNSVGHFLGFGSRVTASSLLWYIYTRADVFIIGRVLGADILGVYTIAAQFPQTIARLVPTTWQRVAYPIFALYQQSPELKQLVIQASSLLFLVCLPLFAGLAAIAPDIIFVMFGPRWFDAVFPLQMLSAVAAIETLTGTLPVVLNAIGRPGVNTLINVMAVVVFPAGYYLGAQYGGLEGVLWASIAVYLYRFLAFLILTCRFLELSLWSYARDHLGSFAAAFVMFFGVVFLHRSGGEWNIYLRLVSCIGFGVISYLALLFITSRQQIGQFMAYIRTA